MRTGSNPPDINRFRINTWKNIQYSRIVVILYIINLLDKTILYNRIEQLDTKIWMECWTDQPGCQFYTGNFIPQDGRYISVCLSVYLSVCLSIYMSVYLVRMLDRSTWVSVYTILATSSHRMAGTCMSVRLSVYLSVYLSVCLSFCLSVCLSICLTNETIV